jgi:hypothetical protein
MLLGCALRPSEAAARTMGHVEWGQPVVHRGTGKAAGAGGGWSAAHARRPRIARGRLDAGLHSRLYDGVWWE